MATRQSIIERHKKGENISSLSREFNVNRGTIRSLIKREQSGGLEGLRPKYEACGKKRPDKNDFIFRAVRCFRTWHPSWGAEKIRAELHRLRPELKLPHYRTMSRWFHWNNQIDIPLATKLPKTTSIQATSLHEIWQIDAKEEMVTRDGSKNCWLNITDEYSGMVISPPVFSQKENQRSSCKKDTTISYRTL